MDILTGLEMQKAIPLFESYHNNQAVIFSVLENQYDGTVYADNKSNMKWAILRTPFLQHFIAGTPTSACEHDVEEVLFDIILAEQEEKEIVVFANSEQWYDILNRIFQLHKGVSDGRKIFLFSRDGYNKVNRQAIPKGITSVVELRKCMPNSHIDTWSAILLHNGQEVSHCNAIMIGKDMAEIDIATQENFRGRGLATLAATLLIDKLLEYNLTPTWSTWPFRLESQHIAQKLGFTSKPDAKAWIWMENM